MMNAQPQNAIHSICNRAYEHYSEEDYAAALRLFYQAWLKVPKPQKEHPMAGTVLSGIGDTYYRMGKFTQAIEALRSALHCQKTSQHDLTVLRLGQSLWNTGEELPAKIYLHRAYRLLGDNQFREENPKYKRAISDLL